ncbi:MAG: sulfur oxidation c-type cytochrome SoxX [Acetobacteraceae bacterium]|jgi:sulfur-oxidizing protein SoxX
MTSPRALLNIVVLSAAVLVAGYGAGAQVPAASPGEALAFDRAKGNCLACHTMRGSDVPSNVGPELKDMKARFPDRADLVSILTNEEARNPQTVMPPFGRNQILSADEINQIVDFLYTL